MEGAPVPTDKDEDICAFIDQYVSCEIPDKETDEHLHSLVTTVQRHSHTHTCRKKGTSCRFHYPKLPSDKTLIAKPPDEEKEPVKAAERNAKYMDILAKMHDILSDQSATHKSLRDILKQAVISYEDYHSALQTSKRGRTVVLKRKPSEINTNYYNPHLLKAWEANIDVQYCLDPYACIAYMVAYITKDEREMSHVLQAVSSEEPNEDWKQKMKRCGRAFLNAREVSAQEAVYRLLSFPLFKCSFRTVFVPADLPEKRVLLMKPKCVIQGMEDEDEDIFMKNIIDKYAARPQKLKSLCLAYFSIWYCSTSNVSKPADTDDEDEKKEVETTGKVIQLNNNIGLMRKAKKPAVLCYHKLSEQKQPEEYFYQQILLYLPWTNEQMLLKLPSFKEHYMRHISEISKNRAEIEHHTEIIEQAVEQFEDMGPPLHAFDEIAPETEQDRDDAEAEGAEADPHFAVLQPEDDQVADSGDMDNVKAADSTPVTYSIEKRPGVLPQQEFYTLIRTLNSKQREIFQSIAEWCSAESTKDKTGHVPDQLCLFVSGGAGTGKSHLLTSIYQMALRRLQGETTNPEELSVVLTAPTGVAAHNISGVTLHSALLLPLGQTKSYVKLSDEKRNVLRSKAGALKLLIIDEISMVGSNLFLQIHHRLCELKSSQKPFGGVSIIVFGDMFQLPPVLQRFVFKSVSDPIAKLTGTLWEHFTFAELTQIMRQKEDFEFANLLNRLRQAAHSENDNKILSERQIDSDCPSYPSSALHVFPTNEAVDDYNNKMLKALTSKKEVLIAVDKKPEALKNYNIKKDSRFTGGLPEKVTVAEGAKVMLIRNIDVADGLVNGAQGTVVYIKRDCKAAVKVIFIHFNNTDVGKLTRQKSPFIAEMKKHPAATPIQRAEVSFTVTKDNRGLTISRYQFPLKLSWACTIHKVQGLTVDEIVVSFDGRYNDGQAYVALSRSRTLSGLHILKYQPSKIRASKAVMNEMDRLRRSQAIPSHYKLLTAKDNQCNISVLNVRSLPLHTEDLQLDPVFKKSHIIILTETWLANFIPSSDIVKDASKQLLRADRPQCTQRNSFRRPGGVAILLDLNDNYTVIGELIDTYRQILAVHIHIYATDQNFNIIAVYQSPDRKGDPKNSLNKIQTLLKTIQSKNNFPIIVTGDFNENLNQPRDLTFYPGLKEMTQHIDKPTHRSGSTLDHFYSTQDLRVQWMISGCYYSDHDWLCTSVQQN